MEVSYFDRKFSSFTDYAVFQIINILSQCIVGNLLGSMKQWKQYRSLKIKILRLVKQQVYITVSYFLEFYYYRLVEEKNMVSKRPGHFPFLLKLFSSIVFFWVPKFVFLKINKNLWNHFVITMIQKFPYYRYNPAEKGYTKYI